MGLRRLFLALGLVAAGPGCVADVTEVGASGLEPTVREKTFWGTGVDATDSLALEQARRLLETQVSAEHARCLAVRGGWYPEDERFEGCQGTLEGDGTVSSCTLSRFVRCFDYDPTDLIVWGTTPWGPGENRLWNCGEVTAANVLSNLCGSLVNPAEIAERFGGDWTPGTRPETLASILNQSRCGAWEVESGCPASAEQMSGWLAEQYFVPLLIGSGAALHWVTLYQIDDPDRPSCGAHLIDDGTFPVECHLIERLMENQGWLADAVRYAGGLGSCTRLRMRRPPSQLRAGVTTRAYETEDRVDTLPVPAPPR